MRKTLGIACLFLAFAIGFGVAGGVAVSRANISAGDVYDMLESSVSLIERTVTIESADEADLSGISNVSRENYVSYQLNEFNTLCLYAHDCTVSFVVDETDSFSAVLSSTGSGVTMQSAITEGCLYIKLISGDDASADDTALTVHIPTGYKGGYEIYGTDSEVSLGDIDSAMDVSVQLSNSTAAIDSITAGEIDLSLDSSSLAVSSISATDTVSIRTASSNINVESMRSTYATVRADSSSLYLGSMAGGFSLEEYLCSGDYDFSEISGNISITSKLSRAEVSIPQGESLVLYHSERFASFTDNTGLSESADADTAYSADTSAEYSAIVINWR